MTNFEDLQKNWLSQPVSTSVQQEAITTALPDKWQRNQRRVFWSNICMSIGFLMALIVIGWVYFTFRDKYEWPFELSIAAVYCSMIIFLFVSWRSYAFKKENRGESSIDFIQHQLQKIRWQRKTLTAYVWIYNITLWFALSIYIMEITKGASFLFTFTAFAVTTLYIFGITLWIRNYRHKKYLIEIDEVIAGLETLLNDLQENEQ
ncbi:hypothetical protein [Pedobacter antarcticus]|uniref:hypothetical protein n=1 Tax=Pedobacter antarcticus TaxID=34086 RepID=UPI00292E4445|nr:hypothetical protein [Pedobacter antarcticus]